MTLREIGSRIAGALGFHSDLTRPAAPAMYTPETQITSAYLTLVARARDGDASALARDARAVIHALDPLVPVYGVTPLSTLVRQSAGERVFVTRVFSAFAAAAVLLAAIGLYGLVAYTVSERTREVGVRVALGARPADVTRVVLGAGVSTIALGVAGGLVIALVATRFLGSLVYGVGVTDSLTLASSTALLLIGSLLAHVAPLRRALRIDPASALRAE